MHCSLALNTECILLQKLFSVSIGIIRCTVLLLSYFVIVSLVVAVIFILIVVGVPGIFVVAVVVVVMETYFLHNIFPC